MNYLKTTVASLAISMAATGLAQAAVVDVVQSPTGFFVPTDAQKSDSPYYRYQNDDWDWMHGAIASAFTFADLLISAFDVDAAQGEVDNIYADDNGTWVLLGSLLGANNSWAFSTFSLGAQFFDDIATGLKVKMDIDVAGAAWAVTLAKSVITTDGATPPPPPPGVIPLPAAGWMMIAGLGGLAALRRRKAA